MPNVENDNYIMHKLVLFIAIFCYQFLLSIVTKIRDKCKIDINQLISESLQMALFCVIGYSIFIDVKYMNSTKVAVGRVMKKNFRFIYVTFIIVLVVAIIKSAQLMFRNKYHDCEKY
jgi:hypothetical protein